MTDALVLHDLGAEAAGAPWRAVVPDGWAAPDLPGHGAAPAPRHGAYDPLGPATLARWALGGSGVVVGVGANAHGALVLAAGGACERAVVVDGLWGPWRAAEDQIAEMYAGLRRIVDHEAAVAPPLPLASTRGRPTATASMWRRGSASGSGVRSGSPCWLSRRPRRPPPPTSGPSGCAGSAARPSWSSCRRAIPPR